MTAEAAKTDPQGRALMRTRTISLSAAALAAVLALPGHSQAQSGAALTGQVTSQEEGAMEGVLVSAKKEGSTVTVSVVSDDKGNFSFPATKLEPGKYNISIRAIGYDLQGPGSIDVAAGKAATADVKLVKTRNIARQMSNGEWIMSVPGSEQQKLSLLNCVSCHTLERIVKSSYDKEGFQTQILSRMGSYANQSMPMHVQKRVATRLLEERGDALANARAKQAEFLSSINLSEATAWEYDLKTNPRPKGRGTKVIITQYDLPRPSIEPHDVIVGADGNAYYSNFGEQTFGMIDPKTGRHTEYPMPELKKGWPTGMLGLRPDKDGNMWLGMMYQGAIGKFDLKTKQVSTWSMPPEMNKDQTQVNMVRAESSHVDGKVWSQNNGFAAIHRLDLKTGQIESLEPFKAAGVGETHNIYDIIPDSKNNAYFTDIAAEYIGKVDRDTMKVTLYQMPKKPAGPRRGMMDAQDRIWFGEYRGNRIGMFDTKTETFKEWDLPTPWSNPYDVVIDKNEEAWTGSMINDRVVRLDTKTGRFVEYLLPKTTNIRRVYVDNSTSPVTFWVGSNHGASIIKLEPQD
jgi:virginiamycin B lyase